MWSTFPWQTSSRDESFLDLSIDIEQNTSVTSCLRQFSASETLCQRNKFYCDTCCGLQEAEKRCAAALRLPDPRSPDPADSLLPYFAG